ncbi:MAG: tetratricopeptide repeat protein [Gammaproteobacteria bacterium]|nr:tetratricopeptide repeat protein [Gammaproteobacteria bacterium]
MSFFRELKRRNVFRVVVAYLVIGWLLAQVAVTLEEALNMPVWFDTVVVSLLIIGFPLAIIFAWAFEMTSEGIKREKDVIRDDSITHLTAKKLDVVTIVAAVGVAAIVAWQQLAPVRSPVEQTVTNTAPAGPAVIQNESKSPLPEQQAYGSSIAVLPFTDMSPDKDQEYFSDGMAEELLNVLVKIEQIKVASRTSSFAFKGKGISIPEIARQLKVDHILEGSVRKAGEKVRITAQLIDVSTDRHLWSDTYDRDLHDIFAIQDEIANAIVAALKIALGTDQQSAVTHEIPDTENLEAFELFLRGRALWQRRGPENIKNSIRLLEQATKLDPEFARAWSALAAAHVTLSAYDHSAVPEEQFARAAQLAKHALTLDATLAEAYATLGDFYRNQADWQTAESNYKNALRLEPGNTTVNLWYSEFLEDVGRLQDALPYLLKAVDLDPLSPGANSNLAFTYYALGDYKKSMERARVAGDLGHPFGPYVVSLSALAVGDYETAEEYLYVAQRMFDFPEEERISIAGFMEVTKNPEQLDPFFEQFGQLMDEPNAVMLYVRYGRLDEAFEHIPMQRDHWANSIAYLWNAQLSALRQHPRFKEIVTAAGLVEYWRRNSWPDRCRPVGEGFECD